MGIINNFFNTGNESKLDKLTVAQGELNSKVSDLNNKLSQVAKVLELAKTDLMIEENASTKKAVAKYEKSQEKFQAELTSAQEELSKVSNEISVIMQEESHAELVDTARQDAKAQERILKHAKIKEFFRKKVEDTGDFQMDRYYHLKILAEKRGDLIFTSSLGDLNDNYKEVYREEEQKVKVKVDKDFEEFMKAFDKYFGE
ncbi:hypothetical protein BACERE00175_01684 [Bacillus cereus]|uniref:hypothetical protein n=1 Tax=Bacillus cereus TaxID=1396 RepID=UPI000A301FE9|nr:hypothetical protein [Bacillus cereus]KAA2400558.1 hypothetical protein F2Y18_07670 [Bacillus cereus]SMD81931.1 hypothetical protein BACERE00175_01684 [Bacillus cereus]